MEPQTPASTPSTTPPPTGTPTTVNINPAPATPLTPEPVIDPTPKKSNTLAVVLLTFLITALLFVGGYYAYKIYYPNTSNTYVVPSSSPYASATPYGSASPYASPGADSGKVEGKICYPSEGIPAGKVVAKNISTNELTSFDYAANTSALSVSLPAGTYYLRYEPNGQGLIGYYTNCTGSEASCQDKQTKRASIPVVVETGKTATGVSLCDYYYETGMEPTF